jgi:hypothetical protein
LSRILVPDPEKEFWTSFHTATKKQWLPTWTMGIPPIIVNPVDIYFLSRAFNVHAPFLEHMVVAPLTMAIAALTIVLPFVRTVFRAIVGLTSLRPALQDMSALS